jgi:hypothetical protein
MPKKVVLNVTPDRLDLRDRPYLPAVALAPPAALSLTRRPPPMDQGESSACTGFALASVIDHLLARSGRAKDAGVSPWMIYSMARRYDEFPGVAEDAGSSLRGALKGWYKHGACSAALWKNIVMPRGQGDAPGEPWWLDAVNRPLGAYYRVDMRSVTDMHVALNEVGALYASALTHAGWFEADKGNATIPLRPRKASDGGHAFAIVGYDRAGFLVRNSWGPEWGDGGYATLTYEDWLENAMDCWVAQLGVVTDEHRRVAEQATPAKAGMAALSPDRILQNHQLAPYVIDMENDGRLSRSGTFRTSAEDVRALAHEYLDAARRQWKLAKGTPIDIAIYAHGGLTSEMEAAETFARWMPALYGARKFPVFLMWESDLWSTIAHAFEDVARARPTAGPLESLSRWWNERLEGLLAPAGTALWSEMKENAAAISAIGSGGQEFFDALRSSSVAREHPVRLHLVGHSAGAIALAYLVDRLAAQEWEFESVSFMAPAITVGVFMERVGPWLESRHVKRYRQYHLADAAELTDSTTRPILGYGRSLLYLVSRSFEGHGEAPILGMQRHFPAALARRRSVKVVAAPSAGSAVTTHGGFDDDAATMRSVIASMDEKR